MIALEGGPIDLIVLPNARKCHCVGLLTDGVWRVLLPPSVHLHWLKSHTCCSTPHSLPLSSVWPNCFYKTWLVSFLSWALFPRASCFCVFELSEHRNLWKSYFNNFYNEGAWVTKVASVWLCNSCYSYVVYLLVILFSHTEPRPVMLKHDQPESKYPMTRNGNDTKLCVKSRLFTFIVFTVCIPNLTNTDRKKQTNKKNCNGCLHKFLQCLIIKLLYQTE